MTILTASDDLRDPQVALQNLLYAVKKDMVQTSLVLVGTKHLGRAGMLPTLCHQRSRI